VPLVSATDRRRHEYARETTEDTIEATAEDTMEESDLVAGDLIEEISIDGMCGVY
jgi:mycofactocin precursor